MPLVRCLCPLETCVHNDNTYCICPKMPVFKFPFKISVEDFETGKTYEDINEKYLVCDMFVRRV